MDAVALLWLWTATGAESGINYACNQPSRWRLPVTKQATSSVSMDSPRVPLCSLCLCLSLSCLSVSVSVSVSLSLSLSLCIFVFNSPVHSSIHSQFCLPLSPLCHPPPPSPPSSTSQLGLSLTSCLPLPLRLCLCHLSPLRPPSIPLHLSQSIS